jgi:hypothetical protein
VVHGGAATPAILSATGFDTQVWQAVTRGDIRIDKAANFGALKCDASVGRHPYAIDPWGSPYWITIRDAGDARRLAVYSLGANRRRDGEPGVPAGDDIVVALQLPPK